MSDRPMRSCDVCGQIDDHPRHIFDTLNSGQTFEVNEDAVLKAMESDLPAEVKLLIVDDLRDTVLLTRHMDCCRDAGCPTGDCDNMPEAQKKLQGHKLVAAITGEKA